MDDARFRGRPGRTERPAEIHFGSSPSQEVGLIREGRRDHERQRNVRGADPAGESLGQIRYMEGATTHAATIVRIDG
jgi:hypothetical protein